MLEVRWVFSFVRGKLQPLQYLPPLATSNHKGFFIPVVGVLSEGIGDSNSLVGGGRYRGIRNGIIWCRHRNINKHLNKLIKVLKGITKFEVETQRGVQQYDPRHRQTSAMT